MKSLRTVVALTALTALVSCGSMKDRIDSNRTAHIKKVAIIGFDLNQKQPTDNLGIAAFKNLKNTGMDGLSSAPEMRTMATKSYESLRTSLAQTTGWNVMSLADLHQNKQFTAYVKSMMTGPRTVALAAKGYEQFVVPGTLDHFAVVNKMDQSKRDELARALGVDAIVSVVQHQDLEQPWMSVGHISGDAKFEATTRSSLMAYTPGSAEPVWQVSNVKGKAVNSEKFGKQERLSKISLTGIESSASSTEALSKTYTR